MKRHWGFVLVGLIGIGLAGPGRADDTQGETPDADETMDSVELDGMRFRVAPGWKLQTATEPGLTRYPIHADLSPDGRLWVVESSGSNAPTKQQVEERPHRLVVLEDTSGDGRFDRRTVFAERLMLPQGVMWTEDGVLAGTPPEIWRYRDTNGDGVSDEASVWFDGKTLTGCANDLHGPFLGRDGWVHWCKGAFAEQTYAREDGSTWSTRASHILRQHPRTGVVESVMTGGMDNPVEFAMSLCGERFFTCTFIQHPADGRRDALVHAQIGGVYGKDHGVLDGHLRTGPLMPVMTHLGPAAPAGLMFRDGAMTDDGSLGELLVAQFNLQRVSRHQLVESGAGLTTIDSDLLVAERPDFHPTDVLEDIDGSLLVVDTGGWYTLCCPTSHIDQSQANGGLYRLVPDPATTPEIATAVGSADGSAAGSGRAQAIREIAAIDWAAADAKSLVDRLGDPRPMVRRLARARLLDHPDGAEAVVARLASGPRLQGAAAGSGSSVADASNPSDAAAVRLRVHAAWCLIDMIGRADEAAQSPLLDALVATLDSADPTVRLIATQGLGTHRHRAAAGRLVESLDDSRPRQRRFAAEALGRLGDPSVAGDLLAHVDGTSDDRALEHALLFALIELGQPAAPALHEALANGSADGRLAALRVLDQIGDPGLEAERVLEIFRTGDSRQRELAGEILARRAEWGELVAKRLPELLRVAVPESETARWQATLQGLVLRDSLAVAVGGILADGPAEARDQILAALVDRPPTALPAAWVDGVSARLNDAATDRDELTRWARILSAVRWKESAPAPLSAALAGALRRSEADQELWLILATAVPPGFVWPGDEDAKRDSFVRLVESLGEDAPPAHRQRALAALSRRKLTEPEAVRLAGSLAGLGPMETSGVLTMLRPFHQESVNHELLTSLESAPALESLPDRVLEEHFAEHPDPIRGLAATLIRRHGGDRVEAQRQTLRRIQDELPAGDALRGFQVFRSSKAACSACHSVGYYGGKIGPDLTRINRIRTVEDLLEAIVYPSASFVRSYESYLIVTDDGRAISGVIADEDATAVTLITGIDQRTRIERDEIESFQPAAISIMPAGLDQQLSLQELADLIAFLKSER
ncbi:MAG: dehydrogenase [Planctomycetaceae bacterium]|nr:MAG: dehydrogenase [Planctomycetaceae bacterium]